MDFSVGLLHSTEKKLNAEISRLMKAVKVSTVSDLNLNTLGKLQKGPSTDFLNAFVTLLESNMSLCKAAASSIDEMKSKVLDTQNQLIHRQQDELAKVKDTVQTEMKSWADVARKNDKQNRQLTAKSVKEAVKAVSEEEERSKNIIVYGVTDEEETETDWEGVLKIDKASDTVKSICEVTDCLNVEIQSCSRIGKWKSDKIRPIKVQCRTSSDVDLLLRRACKLKSSEEFTGVYLAPDRTPEQRATRNKLVQQMKELINKDSSKHYFIRDDKVRYTDKK